MVRLVNKSLADCYTNYANGKSLYLKRGSYVILGDLNRGEISYYSRLRLLGLYLEGMEEEEKLEPVEYEIKEESTLLSLEGGVDSTSNSETLSAEESVEKSVVEKLPIDSLMKRTKAELLEIAEGYNILDLKELSKRQIAERIVESYGE